MAQKLLDSTDAPAEVLGQQEVPQVDSQQVGQKVAGLPVPVFDKELGHFDGDAVKQKKEVGPPRSVEGGEIGGEQGVKEKVRQLVDVGDCQGGLAFGQRHQKQQRGGKQGEKSYRSPQERQPA